MADHDAEKLGLKLLGDNKVEAALRRLDKLIQEEVRATAAQTLGVISRLEQNTRVIMDRDKLIQEDVLATTMRTLEVASRIEQTSRGLLSSEQEHRDRFTADQFRQHLQNWLSPPNPWKNHNMACAARHDGTTTWFTQSDTLVNWQSSGSLLWVCGKRQCSLLLQTTHRD
jgi:hypothetical protein